MPRTELISPAQDIDQGGLQNQPLFNIYETGNPRVTRPIMYTPTQIGKITR